MEYKYPTPQLHTPETIAQMKKGRKSRAKAPSGLQPPIAFTLADDMSVESDDKSMLAATSSPPSLTSGMDREGSILDDFGSDFDEMDQHDAFDTTPQGQVDVPGSGEMVFSSQLAGTGVHTSNADDAQVSDLLPRYATPTDTAGSRAQHATGRLEVVSRFCNSSATKSPSTPGPRVLRSGVRKARSQGRAAKAARRHS